MKRKQIKWIVMCGMFLLAMIMVGVFFDIPLQRAVTIPLSSEQGESLPTVFLSEIETAPGIVTAQEMGLGYTYSNENRAVSNKTCWVSNLVVARQYQKPDATQDYEPRIITNYYSCRFAFLRNWVVERYVDENLFLVFFEESENEALVDARFDFVQIARTSLLETPALSIVSAKGKKILCVVYFGFAEESTIIDEMARVLE